ncbi:hypothetical protein J1614_008221 [Plenodomus biglobosus]|nr:hypothetical protein J1614_008221 [Plenodomus biglobosus]
MPNGQLHEVPSEMTRLLLLIFGTLLALSSFVQAEDKLRVYSFPVKACDASPQLVNIDISRDKCHNLATGAQSFRPFKHEDNTKWIDNINNGSVACRLVAYSSHNCLPGTVLGSSSLPRGIQQCLDYLANESALSIQFQCLSTTLISSLITTETSLVTSWSLGTDGKATPYEKTTTAVRTSFITSTRSLFGRAAEATASELEQRQQNNHTGVWMFHPWSGSLICYDCYTYKTDDFSKFDCRSGLNNPIDCGLKPAHKDDSTSTVTTRTTATVLSPTHTFTPVTTTTTRTRSSSSSSAAFHLAEVAIEVGDIELGDGDIEKRSWHRRVRFMHPYKAGVPVCADAEWEKRGKPENEIRLQKVTTDMEKCEEGTGTQDLNVPDDVVITAVTTVTTHSVSVVQSTRTTTVSVADDAVERDVDELVEVGSLHAGPSHLDL